MNEIVEMSHQVIKINKPKNLKSLKRKGSKEVARYKATLMSVFISNDTCYLLTSASYLSSSGQTLMDKL